MNIKTAITLFASFLSLAASAQRPMEYLDRGLVATPDNNGNVFISWRLLGTEDYKQGFNLYKTTNGKASRLNQTPILAATNFTDKKIDTTQTHRYTVKAIINGKEEKQGAS